MTDYKALLEYCTTDRQIEVIGALIKHGSQRSAAKELGCSRSGLQSCYNTVQTNAKRRLYAPENGLNHPVPENFTGDFTIQRDGEGNIERSWMKGKLDKAKEEAAYVDFISGLNSEIKPAPKTKKPKQALAQDLASAIIFGDAHIGELAHKLVTLVEDYNLETATADIRAAIDYCIDCAIPSEEGWFINVGDWLHADSHHNNTTNGTRQDMAANHSQVMRAAGTVIRYAIDKMLTKFGKVIVINARGNHDGDSAFALNMYIEGVYEGEPRVDVRGNDSKFNFIEFGKCLIGVNHGDKVNHERLAGVMTRMAAEAWGRTTYRRWWNGHVHHKQMIEHASGITFEVFHSLAPVEAWHSGSGYGAERRVTMITLHKEFGEVNRMTPSIEMIRAH